ncbi:MAG: malate dehydrogenase [Zestosphaera tikiterensis]|uniref:Malate dehydrogenase n=1 Tax=Zestosphaera tikiterensis TaxID=1973259 RepID=A0A2R7Y591_9CREN|nr:MAG: malate dehydrogenase [Zestosphaera tikiterensis]
MSSSRDWFEISERLHRKYAGKIEVVPKVPVTGLDDFSIWYTPGVAEPCRRIRKGLDEGVDKSFEYTLRWNYAAVVSDGTRVLGLGNIGPEAGLPVMEGKSLLFKFLGGVDAVPIVLREKDPEKFIYIVKALEPSFGAINLEDIESPKCFYILEKLQEILEIPVWHDDQQGTALVNIAGLINALKVVGKKIDQVKIALIGAGAANIALYRYLKVSGANPKNIISVDSKGILHPERGDIEELRRSNPWKYQIAVESNGEGVKGGIREAMKGADVVIAASKPGPGVIKKEWVQEMNKDAIVFAEANPIPEIWPWEAKEAGARVVATGRSDFPNQINNSLGFPAVFRGVLTARAKKMSDEMFLAAAHALAKHAESKGIHEEYIIPSMDDLEAYVVEAIAVAEKAMELGLARRTLSRSELEAEVRELISRPRKYMEVALKEGLIKPF